MESDDEAHRVVTVTVVLHVPRPAQVGGGEQHRLRPADDKEAVRAVDDSERRDAIQTDDGKLAALRSLIALDDPLSGQRLGREAGRRAENLEQAPRADRGARHDGTTGKAGEKQHRKKPRQEAIIPRTVGIKA